MRKREIEKREIEKRATDVASKRAVETGEEENITTAREQAELMTYPELKRNRRVP